MRRVFTSVEFRTASAFNLSWRRTMHAASGQRIDPRPRRGSGRLWWGLGREEGYGKARAFWRRAGRD